MNVEVFPLHKKWEKHIRCLDAYVSKKCISEDKTLSKKICVNFVRIYKDVIEKP
jgi:hypothetical protein